MSEKLLLKKLLKNRTETITIDSSTNLTNIIISIIMSWHIYLFWGFSTTTKPRVPLIIIPNNEYGKYYPGVVARPEYGSVLATVY